jgi:hypothetical protein
MKPACFKILEMMLMRSDSNSLPCKLLRIAVVLSCVLAACPYLHAATDTDAKSAAASSNYAHRLASARDAYFRGIEGHKDADTKAREDFDALEHDYPQESVVMAYQGSLELLESARTWAVWKKHTLATDGLAKLDEAVKQSPDNLEVRFIRAATTYHLPFFFHRKQQAEEDFAFIAPRSEEAARKGTFPPALAAASLSYYGEILADKGDTSAARQAYQAAVRVDENSPGGKDAKKRLKQ